jgi:tyrosine-protein kinase Etk/Wzc
VLLIDADLRRGVIHSVLDAAREPGLADILQGSTLLLSARRVVKFEGRSLHFLTAGTGVAHPSALLKSDALSSLLAGLREEYDAIILDSPPVNVVSDSALLSAHADGVILVARAAVTETGALRSALEQLSHVRAPVLGVLLNDIDFSREASYDSSYRYYNYNQYIHAPTG